MSEEFDILYQEDYKNSEHLKIDYLLYFDDDEDKYIKADIELFGKSFLLQTYCKNGDVWKGIRSNTKGEVLPIRIIDRDDEMFVLEIGSTVLKVYYDSYKLIKKYYYEIYNSHIKNMENTAKSIISKVDDIIEDEDLLLMINNFLDNIPIDIYLNPAIISQVEAYLIFNQDNCGEIYLLYSDEIVRSSYAKIKTYRSGNRIQEKIELKNENLVIPYFNNHFNLLSEIILDKYNLDDKLSLYIVYILVNRIIRNRFVSEWSNEYGDYFENINDINLDTAIENYISIDTITHDSINTAGKFVFYLMENHKFTCNDNYFYCNDKFVDSYNKVKETYRKSLFKKSLQQSKKEESKQTTSIFDIDLMDGIEFEHFIAELFVRMGYNAEVTKQSGDQGIDVIAEKNSKRIGIQAKCYSNQVGNSAIQEVVAGIRHYNLDKAIVVTNNYFTNSASELAKSNNVILWDRNILKEKIAEVYT